MNSTVIKNIKQNLINKIIFVIILHGLSEYLGISCSNNIGLFLNSLEKPNIYHN